VSLLDATVPVSRDTIELAVEKAALACCRGPVQSAVVLSLIELGYIDKTYEHKLNIGSRQIYSVRYNGFVLDPTSWTHLRKRLKDLGFVFIVESQGKSHTRYTARWRSK
jgi:hypothetical protein